MLELEKPEVMLYSRQGPDRRGHASGSIYVLKNAYLPHCLAMNDEWLLHIVFE